ncbi:hypothetical protein [Maridesulfovibrio sp.]|uniref:hypothetical protein n=1 Tax=Maridesulfovibrio sp. TaxID=2795000 RepID=UPI002A1896DA|nr:hypothetical protein [Maridesulfovibrio sp.]
MIKLRKTITLLFLLTVALTCPGCAGKAKWESAQVPDTHVEEETFVLQHSGVLDVAGRRMPLRGMLRVQPASGTARIIIMNELGIKLLIADIRAVDGNGFESRTIFSSPFARAVPFLQEETSRCIYRMFLGGTDVLTGLETIGTEPQEIGGHIFFKHTVIKNARKNYTVELFLNSGSRSGN